MFFTICIILNVLSEDLPNAMLCYFVSMKKLFPLLIAFILIPRCTGTTLVDIVLDTGAHEYIRQIVFSTPQLKFENPAWCISNKKRNKLQHARNGNTHFHDRNREKVCTVCFTKQRDTSYLKLVGERLDLITFLLPSYDPQNRVFPTVVCPSCIARARRTQKPQKKRAKANTTKVFNDANRVLESLMSNTPNITTRKQLSGCPINPCKICEKFNRHTNLKQFKSKKTEGETCDTAVDDRMDTNVFDVKDESVSKRKRKRPVDSDYEPSDSEDEAQEMSERGNKQVCDPQYMCEGGWCVMGEGRWVVCDGRG